MKTATLNTFIFVIIIFSSNLQYPQTRNLNDRLKERKQTEERNTNKNDKQPGRTRNDNDESYNFHKEKKERVKIEKPIITEPTYVYRPGPKPKTPIYCEQIVEIPFETEIIEMPRKIKLPIDEVYPNFPLRFVNTEINYIFSQKNEDGKFIDIYQMNFSIKPKTDSYFTSFGIQILSSNKYDLMQIFNEDENILYQDSIYNFSSEIELENSGYIILRIGYYYDEDEIFYPAIEIPNKTDLLIFVSQNEKKNFIEE